VCETTTEALYPAALFAAATSFAVNFCPVHRPSFPSTKADARAARAWADEYVRRASASEAVEVGLLSARAPAPASLPDLASKEDLWRMSTASDFAGLALAAKAADAHARHHAARLQDLEAIARKDAEEAALMLVCLQAAFAHPPLLEEAQEEEEVTPSGVSAGCFAAFQRWVTGRDSVRIRHLAEFVAGVMGDPSIQPTTPCLHMHVATGDASMDEAMRALALAFSRVPMFTDEHAFAFLQVLGGSEA